MTYILRAYKADSDSDVDSTDSFQKDYFIPDKVIQVEKEFMMKEKHKLTTKNSRGSKFSSENLKKQSPQRSNKGFSPMKSSLASRKTTSRPESTILDKSKQL